MTSPAPIKLVLDNTMGAQLIGVLLAAASVLVHCSSPPSPLTTPQAVRRYLPVPRISEHALTFCSVSCTQTWYYFTLYPNDRIGLRFLVSATLSHYSHMLIAVSRSHSYGCSIRSTRLSSHTRVSGSLACSWSFSSHSFSLHIHRQEL